MCPSGTRDPAVSSVPRTRKTWQCTKHRGGFAGWGWLPAKHRAYPHGVDIVDFLSERITEDEAVARTLLGDRTVSQSGAWYEQRLLLECEAKRRLIRIVESARQAALASLVSDTDQDAGWIPQSLEWLEQSLNALALPYYEHPDFEPDWLRT